MKHYKLLLGAAAIFALAACSNDEVVNSTASDPNAIKYSVITNNATRAASLYSSSNTLDKDFKAWAHVAVEGETSGSFTPGATYFSETAVKYSSTTNDFSTDVTRYWPSTSTYLKFFAVANDRSATYDEAAKSGDVTRVFNNQKNGKLVISNYNIEPNVENQLDMLYAVTKPITRNNSVDANGSTTTSHAGYVPLNFRHALAQLVFKAKNLNSTIYVEIGGVSLCHIATTGSVTISDPTTVNYDIDATTTDVEAGTKTTSWSDSYSIDWTTKGKGQTGRYYTENNSNVYIESLDCVKDGDDGISVAYSTTDVTDLCPYNSTTNVYYGENDAARSMMVIPQNIEATTLGTTKFKITSASHGDFFMLKCKIWNVAGDDVDKDNDVMLLGSKATADESEGVDHWGYILVPIYTDTPDGASSAGVANIISKWDAGKKYVYTFIFDTDGDGGIPIPDPDPEDTDPDDIDPNSPTLLPISYTVKAITVDDYNDGTGINKYVDKDNVVE